MELLALRKANSAASRPLMAGIAAVVESESDSSSYDPAAVAALAVEMLASHAADAEVQVSAFWVFIALLRSLHEPGCEAVAAAEPWDWWCAAVSAHTASERVLTTLCIFAAVMIESTPLERRLSLLGSHVPGWLVHIITSAPRKLGLVDNACVAVTRLAEASAEAQGALVAAGALVSLVSLGSELLGAHPPPMDILSRVCISIERIAKSNAATQAAAIEVGTLPMLASVINHFSGDPQVLQALLAASSILHMNGALACHPRVLALSPSRRVRRERR